MGPTRAFVFCASLAAVTVSMAGAQTTSTHVDAARHEVSLIVSPFDVPAMAAGQMAHDEMGHAALQMNHGEGPRTLYQFTWPVDGYAKGFRVEVRDANGKLLPRSLLHHVTGVNLDRRQLIYSSSERLFGIGKETEAVLLPGSLAVPLEKGDRIGYYVMWSNDSGRDLEGVSVRVVMTWVPAAAKRELIAVLPIWLDVNNEVGGTNTFDLVPGKTTKSFEFASPVNGRILGISGHLHDYGVAMRLEDAESGETLVALTATKDSEGHIKSVARKFYAFNAIRLRQGHRYRVVAQYDSPLREAIPRGAMGNIVGVIAPDDLADWPSVDPDDPDFRRDMASLGLGSWTPRTPAKRSGDGSGS